MPVAFGATTAALGVALDDARLLYLHITAHAAIREDISVNLLALDELMGPAGWRRPLGSA